MITSEIIASDLPKGVALLAEINTLVRNVISSLQSLKDRIESEQLNFSGGIDLLDLKNYTFLSYLSNLAYVILRKLSGLPLEGDPSIGRLVEARIILERVRPLEEKFKYQIDKYLKIGKSGFVKKDEPISMRGNLDRMVGSSDEEEDKKEKETNTEVYKIPKLIPTAYSEEESKGAHLERQRKRFLQSAMISDALAEYTEDPEIIYNDSSVKDAKLIRRMKEIERFEEDNFTRVPISKHERKAMEKMHMMSTVGKDLLSFRSFDCLEDEPHSGVKRKRKSGKKDRKHSKPKGKKHMKGSKRRKTK